MSTAGNPAFERQQSMITGAIKSQIDQIWNAFWSGGISNPLSIPRSTC